MKYFSLIPVAFSQGRTTTSTAFVKRMYLLPAWLLLFLLSTNTVVGQPKTKPKEKAPTQKDMQSEIENAKKMMNEMMSEMSDEDKKMMDSMGIKMPDLKNLKAPKVSDAQLAEAWEDDTRIVPKKDVKRIGAIPVVSPGRMPAYISMLHQKTTAALDAQLVTAGNKMYTEIMAVAKSRQKAGNMAIGFWMSGQPELTLYLLGKITAEDATQTDNISNYASALTMLGGEHLAIPLLQNLNARFRKNSTILNNLGQAWFGLGDIVKAEKYLDSALAILPHHPQANMTKAAIEENKGNTSKAIQHVKKSINYAYSKEKEDKLNKLGYKLTRKDLRIPFKPGSDPLGLQLTNRPDYPTSVAKVKALYPNWQSFNEACDKSLEKMEEEYNSYAKKYGESSMAMAKNAMAMINSGTQQPFISLHPLNRKASMALQQLEKYYGEKFKNLASAHLSMQSDIESLRKKILPPAADNVPCDVSRQWADRLLEAINSRKKKYDDEELNLVRQYCNELVYWSQFTSVDENAFRMIQVKHQMLWIQKNREKQPLDMSVFKDAYEDCTEKEEGKRGKLPDFDDVACNYKKTIDWHLVKWEMNCSKTKITYRQPFQTITENYVGEKYVGGTISYQVSTKAEGKIGPVGVEASVGAEVNQYLDENHNVKDWDATVKTGVSGSVGIKEGPAKLGATVAEEFVVEFGPNGITDVAAVSSAEASAGAFDQTVTIGASDRVSLISGNHTRTSSGSMKGVILDAWK